MEEEEEEEEEEEGDEAIWFDRWEGEGRKKSVEEKENVEGMEDFQSVLVCISSHYLFRTLSPCILCYFIIHDFIEKKKKPEINHRIFS